MEEGEIEVEATFEVVLDAEGGEAEGTRALQRVFDEACRISEDGWGRLED